MPCLGDSTLQAANANGQGMRKFHDWRKVSVYGSTVKYFLSYVLSYMRPSDTACVRSYLPAYVHT
jgi:hypothetical protein